MSETRVSCPLCDRPPGGVHNDSCSRSNTARRALRDKCERKMRPTVFWMKGPIAVLLPGKKKPKIVFNPGIPFVRNATHETWVKGGVPMDTPAVEDFLHAIGALG